MKDQENICRPGRQGANVYCEPAQVEVGSRRDYVKRVFENTRRYLSTRGVDIRCRVDAVRWLADVINPQRILDIGCGDGSITLQLLNAQTSLTVMDISSSMIRLAASHVPPQFEANFKARNEDFSLAAFDEEAFDLVVAVGVMAHVDSPEVFLGKVRSLLSRKGAVVLEFTDAYHPVGRLGRFWSWCKERLAPARYATNKLSIRRVLKLCKKQGFRVTWSYRYSRVPIPGFTRLVGPAWEHKIVKALFGSCDHNRNAWLGNEYILLLKQADGTY